MPITIVDAKIYTLVLVSMPIGSYDELTPNYLKQL